MSFAAEVKQEVAQKIMEGNDIRAELSFPYLVVV